MLQEAIQHYRDDLTAELHEGSPRSAAELDRRLQYLPGGINSGARWRAFPLTFASAEGSKLRDLDGNEYVDCLLGFGPVFLGHGQAQIRESAERALAALDMPGGGSEWETLALEAITQAVPCADKAVFSVSGTEAVQAAFRIARATTGRQLIVRFEGHYHGWVGAPDAASTVVSGRGASSSPAPRSGDFAVLPWNDLDALDSFMVERGSEVAAVIMEAVALNSGTFHASPGYLAAAKEICERHGSLLIFDEVISGFRLALGGVQELVGVTPDLATFAKAMANGYPVAAVAGTEQAMSSLTSGKIVHAGTYTSWPAALAASHTTISTLASERDTLYPRLDSLGQRFAEGIRRVAEQHGAPLRVNQIGSVLQLTWGVAEPVESYGQMVESSLPHVQVLCEGAALGGAYLAPRGLMFLSSAHTEADIDSVIEALSQSLDRMARGGLV